MWTITLVHFWLQLIFDLTLFQSLQFMMAAEDRIPPMQVQIPLPFPPIRGFYFLSWSRPFSLGCQCCFFSQCPAPVHMEWLFSDWSSNEWKAISLVGIDPDWRHRARLTSSLLTRTAYVERDQADRPKKWHRALFIPVYPGFKVPVNIVK